LSDPTTTLLEDALGGDPDAVRRIIHELTPVVHAQVARTSLRAGRRAAGDVHQEVRDLVQTVFVALFEDDAKALRRWEPARGRSLSSFACLIAAREVCSALHSRTQDPWGQELVDPDTQLPDDDGAGPEREVASREALAQVLATLRERLGERGLLLFQMSFVDELQVDEIAEAFEMTEGAVSAWQTRCRGFVREIAAERASVPAGSPRNVSVEAS
jgi:RNA polymerase sigma-70 factor (ECF subfamily)